MIATILFTISFTTRPLYGIRGFSAVVMRVRKELRQTNGFDIRIMIGHLKDSRKKGCPTIVNGPWSNKKQRRVLVLLIGRCLFFSLSCTK